MPVSTLLCTSGYYGCGSLVDEIHGCEVFFGGWEYSESAGWVAFSVFDEEEMRRCVLTTKDYDGRSRINGVKVTRTGAYGATMMGF